MRVLVCRPAADAGATAAALARAGHEPLCAPVLAIVPLAGDPVPPDGEALVVTSRHAIEATAPSALVAWRARPLFAVGAATAGAARRHGFRDIRVGAGDGEALADLVRLTLRPGARLAYLAGRHRKTAVEAALGAAGYRLIVREVYDARPLPWPEAAIAALRTGGVDAALHYSRRSAALALAAARAGGVEGAFLALMHIGLSADALGPLRPAGATRLRVAERPEEASLLAQLDTPGS